MGEKVMPLSEWTLGEIALECQRHHVCCDSGCAFFRSVPNSPTVCAIQQLLTSVPYTWDLSRLHSWTCQDIEDAKMIKRVFGDIQIGVIRDNFGNLCTRAIEGYPGTHINPDMFPSLKEGEAATLEEIIAAGEGELWER